MNKSKPFELFTKTIIKSKINTILADSLWSSFKYNKDFRSNQIKMMDIKMNKIQDKIQLIKK